MLVWPDPMALVAHQSVALLSAIMTLLTQNMLGAGTWTQYCPMLLTM